MSKRVITSTLDFSQWYRDYMAHIGFAEQPPTRWDKRAHAMQQKGLLMSPYIQTFLAAIDFKDVSTVLDVGSGNGVLALQIAPLVEQVYCLDYSRVMLDYVELNARAAGLDNITTIHLSKEDEWQGRVPEVDILISSRSGLDADVERLFNKFHRYAKKHIYYSYLVGGHFDQAAISELLNQQQAPYPDYIHIVNVLYEMGIDANLNFVQTAGRLENCTDETAFLKQMEQQYGELGAEQTVLLKDFFHQEKAHFNGPKYGMKWALINWPVPHQNAASR
ncbi:tRNA 5-carboxymethoxyuridine methyltransferase [Oligella sp. MSHR50489EDL]|uniref:class I SAM-dependent methyltransferase n=1 Tax=Oligella sp. MSHR50489EDL TaxID=3139409 RepID=UPI003D81BFD8